MSFLAKIFGRNGNSKAIAKERLRLVLVHDRSGIPPELMQVIKNDVITAISRHVRIDREGIEVNLSHDHGLTRLVADIPIISARSSRGQAGTPTSTSKRATRS